MQSWRMKDGVCKKSGRNTDGVWRSRIRCVLVFIWKMAVTRKEFWEGSKWREQIKHWTISYKLKHKLWYINDIHKRSARHIAWKQVKKTRRARKGKAWGTDNYKRLKRLRLARGTKWRWLTEREKGKIKLLLRGQRKERLAKQGSV